MNKNFYVKIKSSVKRLVCNTFDCTPNPRIEKAIIQLRQLANSVNSYIYKERIYPKLCVIIPTTFNLSKIWWAHDGIIAAALRMRGVDIIPTMCDQLQSDEQCKPLSGSWQGSEESDFKKRRKILCDQCVLDDEQLWGIWGIKSLRLTSFVTNGEKMVIKEEVKEWIAGDWKHTEYFGFQAGYEAWKAVVNHDLQYKIKEEYRDHMESMAYHHLLNIRLLFAAYNRIIELYKPDRIFGNGGFYYPWGVIYHIARRNNIPYFHYYKIGLDSSSWQYRRNSLKLIDADNSWESWKNHSWNIEKEKRVDFDLASRGIRISLEQEERQEILQQLKIKREKPIVLALSGVAWDANTLQVSQIYQNVYEWLWDTMDWFEKHSQYQLIIRVHPAENIEPSISSGKRTFFIKETEEKGKKIPENVVVISHEDSISTYNLMHIANIGVVYFSTTGLEMACLGKHVISIGRTHFSKKGFTFDPENREEYYNMISELLEKSRSKRMMENIALLAKKYWYLYAYHGSIDTKLFKAIGYGLTIPKELTYKDLLPGANEYLDYICDSVINDLPIMGENRWPPERK